MLRAIVLSLALLVGIGVLIPLATNYTEASRHNQKRYKKKSVKKYSKKWWQAYRSRKARNKDRAALSRALRLRQIRLARAREIEEIRQKGGKYFEVTNWDGEKWVTKNVWMEIDPSTLPNILPEDTAVTASLSADEKTSKSLKNSPVSKTAIKSPVNADGDSQFGAASISVVGPAQSADSDISRNKTVGGVSTSSLRRTVIDKMIREEGWVVNDYQKEIGGKKVYVVVAQSPGAGNIMQSRLFYFTEVDGKIYSVATNAPVDKSMRLEQESEKVIDSLQRRGATQQASTR